MSNSYNQLSLDLESLERWLNKTNVSDRLCRLLRKLGIRTPIVEDTL